MLYVVNSKKAIFLTILGILSLFFIAFSVGQYLQFRSDIIWMREKVLRPIEKQNEVILRRMEEK